MNLLTAVLKDLPEYQSLREAVENGQVACLSGLGHGPPRPYTLSPAPGHGPAPGHRLPG